VALPNIPLSQRGEIRLGFRCNARCGFCYYQDLLDNPVDKEPTTQFVYEQLRALRREGATEVEFTGGEPTIKPDLVKIVQYARELGFVNISMITNGLRLANREFAIRLSKAGLNDILFSIHGHNAEVHDLHTAIPGSFNKLVVAIHNAKSLGVRVRTSTTLTGENLMYVEDILRLVLDLEASCIHFAVFSPVAQANGSANRFKVSYEDAADSLKRALSRHRDKLPPLSIKYIPFCFMVGFEEYVMNLYQQSYDPDDWNYLYSNKIRRASNKLNGFLFDAISLAGSVFVRHFRAARLQGVLGLKVAGFTRLVEAVRKQRVPACRDCRYDLVCDHVWRDYVKTHGSNAIHPVIGEKVDHPAWSYGMSRYRTPGVPLPKAKSNEAVRLIDATLIS
jgi:MoaA/NifB/PqqE/SkfB family radical SAM enzyme